MSATLRSMCMKGAPPLNKAVKRWWTCCMQNALGPVYPIKMCALKKLIWEGQSEYSVEIIMHKWLDYLEIFVKWGPKILNFEQKCLTMENLNKLGCETLKHTPL